MKELKSLQEPTIIQTHYPIRIIRERKRWVIAQSRVNQEAQTMQNSSVEAAYHRVINAVKTHCMKPSGQYFERDYKTDRSEGLYGMHAFLTANFYWRLDCGGCYDYQATYAFHNCSFEAEVRTMMLAYPLDRAATEKQLQPDFTSFYNSVLAVQEPAFIHSFTR